MGLREQFDLGTIDLLQKLLTVAAWACFVLIAFATLSPAQLRPELSATEPFSVVLLERVGAYAVLGVLFALSYPSRYRLVVSIVFGSAVLFELLQIFVPGRDARVIDAIEKLLGGSLGIVAAYWFSHLLPRRI